MTRRALFRSRLMRDGICADSGLSIVRCTWYWSLGPGSIALLNRKSDHLRVFSPCSVRANHETERPRLVAVRCAVGSHVFLLPFLCLVR